jgi:hypothetical protein
MSTQNNNQKKVFGSYAMENFKGLASAMKVFAIAMLTISVFISLGYLCLLFLLGTIQLQNGFLFSLFFTVAYLGFTIFMTLELLKASNRFRDYAQNLDAQNLDQAFSSLKLYWRYAGILLLVSIVLVILLISVWATKFNAFSTSFQQ